MKKVVEKAMEAIWVVRNCTERQRLLSSLVLFYGRNWIGIGSEFCWETEGVFGTAYFWLNFSLKKN